MDPSGSELSKDSIPTTIVEEAKQELPDVLVEDVRAIRSTGSLHASDDNEDSDAWTTSASDNEESESRPLLSSTSAGTWDGERCSSSLSSSLLPHSVETQALERSSVPSSPPLSSQPSKNQGLKHSPKPPSPLLLSQSSKTQAFEHKPMPSSPLLLSRSAETQDLEHSLMQLSLKDAEHTKNDRLAPPPFHTSKSNPGSLSPSPPKSASGATTSSKRPKLFRNVSSQTLLKNAFSATKLFKKGNKSGGSSSSRSSSPNRDASYGPVRGQSPTGANTPDGQDIFKRDSVPNLDSVNKALEGYEHPGNESKKNEAPSKEPTDLAVSSKQSSEHCERLLNEAMLDRSKGNVENCRSKCVLVTHDPHAKIEDKVLAYNILSTLASPGQSQNYLNDAQKLIWDNVNERPELELLTGVVRSLRESAKTKDAQGERYDGGRLDKAIQAPSSEAEADEAPSPNGNGGGAAAEFHQT